VATRWIDARPATRADLAQILDAVGAMHGAGMLHGDLHLGNLLIAADGPVLLDVQKATFAPWLPALLRRRELGYLAFSLGDPLPDALANTRFWRNARAQRHWKSRTKRCLVESSGFTAFDGGFRRRDADPEALRRAIRSPDGQTLKDDGRTRLYRHDGWIVKQHASSATARAAWVGAQGLAARRIDAARALAWSGTALVMEDAGPTLIDWVEADFPTAPPAEREEMADALADLLGALHRRGIYHADLKANNVAWTPGRAPRLLDYASVHFGRSVPRRRRVKNLAQLNAALPDSVPAELRERALRCYGTQLDPPREDPALRRDVIAESLARGHRWTGCASVSAG
jgi:hypothetical protein